MNPEEVLPVSLPPGTAIQVTQLYAKIVQEFVARRAAELREVPGTGAERPEGSGTSAAVPSLQPLQDRLRLENDYLRSQATQARRMAAFESQRCEQLMDRNKELVCIIDGLRHEHTRLLAKIANTLEQQEARCSRMSDRLVREFHRLAAIWKMDTIHLSDVAEKCWHPAYQQIIALGPNTLPLIFRELEIDPDDWFVALRRLRESIHFPLIPGTTLRRPFVAGLRGRRSTDILYAKTLKRDFPSLD